MCDFSWMRVAGSCFGALVLITQIFGQTSSETVGRREGEPVKIVVPEGLAVPPRLRLDRKFQAGLRCGPNALYLLLRLCGKEVDYDDVAALLEAGDRGVSLSQIKEASSRLGLELAIRKGVAPDDLSPELLPAIVHIHAETGIEEKLPDHFLVVFARAADVFAGFDTNNMIFVDYPLGVLARNMSGYVAIPVTGNRLKFVLNRYLFGGLVIVTVAIYVRHAIRFWRQWTGR